MGKIYLPKDFEIKKKIIKEYHSSLIGGHSGIKGTMKRINLQFWWEGITKNIKEFVQSCVVYQQMKPINQKKVGLLMPLPIFNMVWKDITMNFIIELPQV